MAEEKDKTPKGDINFEYNQGVGGLDMDSTPSQIKKGDLSYALNAALENFDANSITYQNEPGTEFCIGFPDNYQVIGRHFIPEQTKYVFFLANPITGGSEIGYMVNDDCIYHTLINADCLNFDVNFPIHKSVHKTGNCGTELYWAQPNTDRRYINLDADKIPRVPSPGSTPCDESVTQALDCNQIRVQPTYAIPLLYATDVISGGNLIAGAYQFAFQYSDALGNPLSSYHSVTNPTPIADISITTPNFNYPVGKSIVLQIDNIETGGQFGFYNIAVIKTINNITSVELIGTFGIEGTSREIVYSGQNVSAINLTVNDIFEKFPFYGPAEDVTTTQDVLVWRGLSAQERVSYQKIASQIRLQWETWRIPAGEDYADEMNATHLRGYLRDEVYPFEIVFLLTSGKITDAFHIPGKVLTNLEIGLPMIDPSNDDFIEDPNSGPQPYWKIYNTATVIGNSDGYIPGDVNYKGPYQYGEFAYWESGDTYPCDEAMWGDLASQPIRHHKFPDVAISPIVECKEFTTVANMEMGEVARFPIGVKVSPQTIESLIQQSDLTTEQKADIVGFKIVRGDRTDNKSIVAKGMLRNVGKYNRDEQDFYYPNYPYNDLTVDPFLNGVNNALTQVCKPYNIDVKQFNSVAPDPPFTAVEYTDCKTYQKTTKRYTTLGPQEILESVTKPTLVGVGVTNNTTQSGTGPIILADNTILITSANYDIYDLATVRSGCTDGWKAWYAVIEDIYQGKTLPYLVVRCDNALRVYVEANTTPSPISFDSGVTPDITLVERVRINQELSPIIDQPELRYRQIFNSPETSFGQPFLGDVLKLESVIFGKGQAHFVEVKDNAKYRLLTLEAQEDARAKAAEIADDDLTAFFTAYEAFLQLTIDSIVRQNFAYSFNSIADYNYCVAVPDNLQIKQRRIDLKRYLIPAVQNVGESDISINNYQRETSVYLRTEGWDDGDPTALPFPHLSTNMVVAGTPILIEESRYTAGTNEGGRNICGTPEHKEDITVVSYYASLKNIFRNQWGQIFSYQTIDTGFQYDFDLVTDPPQSTTVFGGDTFICRFAYKTKLPFFIDNRVGAPDDSDIFYDEIGNIAYPRYWHSARSITVDSTGGANVFLGNFFSYKAHNFDCPNNQEPGPPAPNPDRNFYDGIFYLFAYGIPNFYVESSYNIDLRQAIDDREGDFWPHVTNSIPDDWVQESWVSIAQDNTYSYNVSFSKQNKETLFTHIPADTTFTECEFTYPFRAIYSDPQVATTDTTVNNWLTYRASNYFDFPQNFGRLVSIDGIERGQMLARFENKTLVYNAMYTTQTNTGGQVYLGQPLFSKQSPPWDYGETDLGYMGTQHKFLLKIPQGQITIDSKRGQVFLINDKNIKDLSIAGSGMNRFLTDHLSFQISRYFPEINVDNHFNGIGLHGVYDMKYDRVIITKLDYLPLNPNIKYDSSLQEFYIEESIPQVPISTTTSSTTSSSTSTTTSSTSNTSTTSTTQPILTLRTRVLLSDTDYFCNKSWTLSYSMISDAWISFHSYLPNWYMGGHNFFYSGIKTCCADGFDFTFLVGEIVPDPTTTTTSSSSTTSTSSTTTTTTTFNCILAGSFIVTDCLLAGTGTVTVPPVTPPCTRPNGLFTYTLNIGYDILSPPSTVVSTASFANACAAAAFVIANPGNTQLNSITSQASAITQGNTVYGNNGTNDCSVIPNGFYFLSDPLRTVLEIVSGVIMSANTCITTTTTSTTPCNMYLYLVDFYTCGACAGPVAGQIGNATLLTPQMWYPDSNSNQKFFIKSYNGCGSGSDRTVLDASKRTFCPEVICPTTTSSTTV